ncbi:MAG: hypothetical protein AAGA92_13380, partial [Planctomycetota bacterium]
METTRLTKEHFDGNGNFTADESLLTARGHIEVDGDLGWLKVPRLVAAGRISIEAGSGIEAGEGIEAGSGIEAGWGIKAGEGIEAGEGIKAGWGIKAGEGIKAG